MQLLAGPAALGLLAGTAPGAIHLLGRHGGYQGTATRRQFCLHPELIAPHQAAGGVQQRQFAAAIAAAETALQPQGGRAAPLETSGASGIQGKAQFSPALPGGCIDHGGMLLPWPLKLGSNHHLFPWLRPGGWGKGKGHKH